MEEDRYAKALLQAIKNLETGLKYYIEKTHELQNEVKVLTKMYENRVEKILKEE